MQSRKGSVTRERNTEMIKEYEKKYNEEHRAELLEKAKKHNQKRADTREQLRKEADESNGSLNLCHYCHKLKDIEYFKFPNGKTYNICKPCAGRRYGFVEKKD